MKKKTCGTMTHDYTRPGTTCLFAALNVLDRTVIGTCFPQHRQEKVLKFLRPINNRDTPHGVALHLILDNYGTQNHLQTKTWLGKDSRFHLHFTPTSALWLNLVKPWFEKITRKRIRGGILKNVPELVATMDEFIRFTNQNS